VKDGLSFLEFAAKLQIDPCVITRIVWVNSKGLKVVVDDDVVGALKGALSVYRSSRILAIMICASGSCPTTSSSTTTLSLGTYYAIYLAARTSLNLKVEFAAKLQIDPCVITRIDWT
jgi:hypothetical protein